MVALERFSASPVASSAGVASWSTLGALAIVVAVGERGVASVSASGL
jgi:hypothetical protein